MAMTTLFTVPPLNKRKRIPMRTIRAMAKYIGKKFQPEEIILFGSHAYGNPQPWSDVDFLIVMDTPKGEMETALEIKKSLSPILFSVDILVRSHQVIEKRKALNDWFLREITSKGKVLYARADK